MGLEQAILQGVHSALSMQADQRIRAQQLNAALNRQLVGGPIVTSMATTQPELNHLHELLPSEKEFIARQLVTQAQADYASAVARGNKAEQQLASLRMDVTLAQANERAQKNRADTAEQKLRALRPELLKVLMPKTAPARVQYELRWPWLAASWASLIAGIVVCAL